MRYLDASRRGAFDNIGDGNRQQLEGMDNGLAISRQQAISFRYAVLSATMDEYALKWRNGQGILPENEGFASEHQFERLLLRLAKRVPIRSGSHRTVTPHQTLGNTRNVF